MNIREKLVKYFNDRGFISVNLHRNDMELFYIGREKAVSAVWIIDEAGIDSMDPDQYMYYAGHIRDTFKAGRFEIINILTLFLTNNVAKALGFGRDIPFWVVDENYGRVVIYEDMPEDFEGLKLPIENMVRMFSDPGVNAYGRTHEEEYRENGGLSGDKLFGAGQDKQKENKGLAVVRTRPYVVYFLVAANLIVFLLTDLFGTTFGTEEWLYTGSISWDRLFEKHEYYRLFTCMFLHADIGHISGNLIGLYSLGEILEFELGHIRFTILYLLGGLMAGIGSSMYYRMNNKYVSSIGASGAVYALIGAVALLLILRKGRLSRDGSVNMGLFIVYIFLSLVQGGDGVDVAAHVCGFIAGGLICICMVMLADMKSRKAGRR